MKNIKEIKQNKTNWKKIRHFGKATAKKMKIKSESEVYRIIGDQ